MFIFMAAAAVDCYALDVPKALQNLPDALQNLTIPPDVLNQDILQKSVQEFRVRKVALVAICLYCEYFKMNLTLPITYHCQQLVHAVVYSPGLGNLLLKNTHLSQRSRFYRAHTFHTGIRKVRM